MRLIAIELGAPIAHSYSHGDAIASFSLQASPIGTGLVEARVNRLLRWSTLLCRAGARRKEQDMGMKGLILTGVLWVGLSANAFTEDFRRMSVFQGQYKSADECPISFCRNTDNGFSMRKWCEKNNAKIGQWPVIVGWTKYNGYNCFCGCNEAWY